MPNRAIFISVGEVQGVSVDLEQEGRRIGEEGYVSGPWDRGIATKDLVVFALDHCEGGPLAIAAVVEVASEVAFDAAS